MDLLPPKRFSAYSESWSHQFFDLTTFACRMIDEEIKENWEKWEMTNRSFPATSALDAIQSLGSDPGILYADIAERRKRLISSREVN